MMMMMMMISRLHWNQELYSLEVKCTIVGTIRRKPVLMPALCGIVGVGEFGKLIRWSTIAGYVVA